MVTLQIDGTGGSAVAGLRKCWIQSAADTPRIDGFNMGPDAATMDFETDYDAQWIEVDEIAQYKNPYRFGWEGFIPHVVSDVPFAHTLAAGIRDVQLAEACAIRCAEAAGALVADSVGVYRARFESALTDSGLRWRSANTRLRWSAAALTARNADADGRREYDAEVEVYEIGSVSNFVR